MPKKKTDPDPIQPSVPSPEFSYLSFTIETFDDPETGKPTHYGRFSRHWQDEKALDVLIDKLEAGQLSHKQALMQARKLEYRVKTIPHLQVVGSVRYSPLAVWHWEKEHSVTGEKATTPPVRERNRQTVPTSAVKVPRWYEINPAPTEAMQTDAEDGLTTRYCPACPSASEDFPHTFQQSISKELQ